MSDDHIFLPLIIKCWIKIEGDILSCSLLPVLVVVVKLENVGSFLTILHLDNLNNIGFTIYVLKYLSTPFPLYCSTIELLECYSIFSVIFRSDYLGPACDWKQKLALLASFTKGILYLRLSSITNKPALFCDLQSHHCTQGWSPLEVPLKLFFPQESWRPSPLWRQKREGKWKRETTLLGRRICWYILPT